MRQNFLAVPQEMFDAARVDGAERVPDLLEDRDAARRAGAGGAAIILFLFSWNSFLWPLLVLSKPEMQTAPVALGALVGLNRVFWNAIMVAAVLMTVPMLILFLFLQRYFIAGITAGAVK